MMRRAHARQRGMVLIASLVVLLLMSVLAASVYQTNLMQLQMAANEQAHSAARQGALAIVDAVLDRAENIPLRGDVGHRICALGSVDAACDEALIVIDDSLIPEPGSVEYFATRQGPLETALPSMAEDRASSGRYYRAALFEVSASYVGSARGEARSRVTQGVLIRLALSGRGGG